MAVRISGVIIPNDKRIEIALTYIFGISRSRSAKILSELKINPDIRTKDLKEDQVNKLRVKIEKEFRVEGDLRRDISANIKRLKEIGSYRGSRHSKGLPSRGQRTKTNTRTVRGNVRRTMGSGRKTAAQKT
ncbi:MAG: 30S ribosomal protein S13 [bacterium]